MPEQCLICYGTGKVFNSERVWNYCDCPLGKVLQKQTWLRASGVPVERQNETLDSFKALPGTESALLAASEVVNGTLSWLLIYGAPGNGKSHLGHGIVLASLEAGHRARVVNALILLSELRSISGTPELTHRLEALARIPLLVIDDFMWATDLEARWLEEIVQRRYLHKQALVALTNQDIKALPGPVISRFHELGKVVLNRGGDYRRKSGYG